MGVCLNNISSLYLEQFEFAKASNYIERGVELQKKITNRDFQPAEEDLEMSIKQY
jgi:cell wall assembly regulator SMI1